MITVTLQKAKAKLNQLVEAARAGQDVVLMRGSKIVARIQPISEEDMELAPRLTETQAKRFWNEVEQERLQSFSTGLRAVQSLKKRRP